MSIQNPIWGVGCIQNIGVGVQKYRRGFDADPRRMTLREFPDAQPRSPGCGKEAGAGGAAAPGKEAGVRGRQPLETKAGVRRREPLEK